jgi:hypothetical protein
MMHLCCECEDMLGQSQHAWPLLLQLLKQAAQERLVPAA